MDRSLSEQGLLEAGVPQSASEAVTPSAPAAPPPPVAPLPAGQIAMMQLHPQGLVPAAAAATYHHPAHLAAAAAAPPPPPQYDPLAVAALSLNTSSATSSVGQPPRALVPTGTESTLL